MRLPAQPIGALQDRFRIHSTAWRGPAGVLAALFVIALAGCAREPCRIEAFGCGGRLPESRLDFDPYQEGRLLSGGYVSEDRGCTWQPLTGTDGTRLEVHDESRVVFGAPGRILFTQVRVSGRGEGAVFAHVVEWVAPDFAVRAPFDAEAEGSAATRRRILDGLYTDDSGFLLATNQGLVPVSVAGPGPGLLRDLELGPDGSIYGAMTEPGRAGLWRRAATGGPWLPVGGGGPILALARGGGTVIYALGERLGRCSGTKWSWSELPVGFRPEGLAADPRRDDVAVFGQGALAVSHDGGRTLRMVPCGFDVVGAAFDPHRKGRLVVVTSQRAAYWLSS